MPRCALIGILLAGACVDSGTLDARLKPMVGTNEPTLVAAMGRAPDTSIRTTPGVSLLQWRWQREYAIPDRVLGYSYTGGPIRPIPLTPIGIVRDACLAEWTIENGVATRYRFDGNDRSAATTPFAAR